MPVSTWVWIAIIAISGAAVYVKCVGVISAWFPRGKTPLTMAVEQYTPEVEVLILASSHGLAGINPSYMDAPVANLCLNSGNYEVQEILLRSHLEKMPNLRYCLVELDNTCLALDRLSGTRDFRELYDMGADIDVFPKPLQWRLTQQILDHDLVRPVVFYQRVTPYELIYIRKKFYTQDQLRAQNIRAKLPDDHIPLNRHHPDKRVPGHSAQLGKMDEERLDHIRDVQLGMKPDIVNPDRVKRNVDALNRILGILRERNIRPIFIKFPYTYAYQRWGTEAWNEVEQDIEAKLRNDYGDDFLLWQFSFDQGFIYEDYADSQHLNKWGAIKFSRLLDQQILALPGIDPIAPGVESP